MTNYNLFLKSLATVTLAIVVVVFSVNPQSAPISKELSFSSVMGALAGIFIIVLLVERVTEIAITIWRESGAEALKADIRSIVESDESGLSSDLRDKQRALSAYQTQTKSIALFIGFTISVIVCAAGVGLLDTVVDIKEGNKSFLRGVDIILTSGLIAGGSDGVHQFASTLESFFKESKRRMAA